MKKDKIIDRIRKCLALANNAGATEHEAAAAMRQAQKLMSEHGIDESALLAAEVYEQYSKAGATKSPAKWEVNLAVKTGKVFGCNVLFVQTFDGKSLSLKGQWRFIGTGPSPEIAKYGFDVLLRQCKKARKAYMETKLKRCTTTKTQRADMFCEGWVYAAVGVLENLKRTPEQEAAIQAYYQQQGIVPVESKVRSSKGKGHGYDALNGIIQGKDAQLRHGVSGSANEQKALEVL